MIDPFGRKMAVTRIMADSGWLWLSALDDASIRKALNQLLPGERTSTAATYPVVTATESFKTV